MMTEQEYPMLAEVIVNQGERIKRLEAEIAALKAGTWQPLYATNVACSEFPDAAGACQYGNYLAVWDIMEEVTLHLPDGVRLCKLNLD